MPRKKKNTYLRDCVGGTKDWHRILNRIIAADLRETKYFTQGASRDLHFRYLIVMQFLHYKTPIAHSPTRNRYVLLESLSSTRWCSVIFRKKTRVKITLCRKIMHVSRDRSFENLKRTMKLQGPNQYIVRPYIYCIFPDQSFFAIFIRQWKDYYSLVRVRKIIIVYIICIDKNVCNYTKWQTKRRLYVTIWDKKINPFIVTIIRVYNKT